MSNYNQNIFKSFSKSSSDNSDDQVFSEEDSVKLREIMTSSNGIYKVIEQAIGPIPLDKKNLMKVFKLNKQQIDLIDSEKAKNLIKMRSFLSVYFFSGCFYCYFHSKKLFKYGKGVKSFYCWLGLIFSSYVLIALGLTKFNNKMVVFVEDILLDKYFPIDENFHSNSDLRSNTSIIESSKLNILVKKRREYYELFKKLERI
jgi:hypothetical protein